MESNVKKQKRQRVKRYFAETADFEKLDLLIVSTDSLTFKEKLASHGRKAVNSLKSEVQHFKKNKKQHEVLHPSMLFN